MSNFKFNPSSAFVVDPTTSISDVIEAMRAHGFGAVLVADPKSKKPTGIFTERDLLKWVDEIRSGGHWDKPVYHLSTRPIFTIALDQIDQAAKIMIEKNIRHLPVIHTDPDTGETIMSMISMRDLLRDFVRRADQLQLDEMAPVKVGMIAQSKGVRQVLREICAQRGNATIETLGLDQSMSAQIEHIAKLDYLFFDLDHFDPKTWSTAMKDLNAHPGHPEVLLVYDPSLHSEQELEVLGHIGLSGRFSAYMKPINVFVLVNRLLLRQA